VAGEDAFEEGGVGGTTAVQVTDHDERSGLVQHAASPADAGRHRRVAFH